MFKGGSFGIMSCTRVRTFLLKSSVKQLCSLFLMGASTRHTVHLLNQPLPLVEPKYTIWKPFQTKSHSKVSSQSWTSRGQNGLICVHSSWWSESHHHSWSVWLSATGDRNETALALSTRIRWRWIPRSKNLKDFHAKWTTLALHRKAIFFYWREWLHFLGKICKQWLNWLSTKFCS